MHFASTARCLRCRALVDRALRYRRGTMLSSLPAYLTDRSIGTSGSPRSRASARAAMGVVGGCTTSALQRPAAPMPKSSRPKEQASWSIALPPIPDTFALGVCDYPEHVPWEQWKAYPERQRELGHHLCPHRRVRLVEDGADARACFDWHWLDDAVEALHAEGLKVVMCTPTATPPAWLIRKHPEILPHRQGRPRPQLRLPQALRPRQPDLPRALPPHHPRDRRALRAASGGRRLANRQRMGLPLDRPAPTAAPACPRSGPGWKSATARSTR